MIEPKGKIGIKEYFAIVILIIGTKVQDDTPALIYQSLKNAGWMSTIIIGGISSLLILLLLNVLTRYKGKSFIDIIYHVFGKYVGYMMLFILWIISSGAIILDTAIYTDIIHTMYFTRTPSLLIYALLMAVCAYVAKKGLEQIGSVSWIVIPYVKVAVWIALILMLVQGTIAFLFPLFGPGVWEITKESALRSSILIDFLFLCLLTPYIRRLKDFKKGTWLGLLYITFQATVGLAAFVLLFDYKSVEMLNFPFHEAIRYIHLGFIANVETLFFPFWLISVFVRFSVYLYVCALLFGALFKIHQFEYAIPALATLFLFIGMIPDSPTFTIFRLREDLIVLSTAFFAFFPILLWVMSKIKGDFKNEKAKQHK